MHKASDRQRHPLPLLQLDYRPPPPLVDCTRPITLRFILSCNETSPPSDWDPSQCHNVGAMRHDGAVQETTPHADMNEFAAPTREWFLGAFGSPTPAQAGAWSAIAGGAHSLVVAPTGSGKTLAAFLWALDGLIARAGTPLAAQQGDAKQGDAKLGTRVLYISPLKALGVDVERNLRAPLIGITQTATRLGLDAPQVSVGVRSGDTPANERRRLLSHPPDILITTPESLYLMLTAKARETLTDVHTIIIDEVHAVAGSKRGAHLALSLERLDALLETPAQRIGLSATVEPHSTVARFLGGNAPVTVVAPASTKNWNLAVTVPVADMTELPPLPSASGVDPGAAPASGLQPNVSIWPHVEEKIVDAVLAKKSTIIFANSRRLAERLTGRLNEIYAERLELAALETSAGTDDGDDAHLAAATHRTATAGAGWRATAPSPAEKPPGDRSPGEKPPTRLPAEMMAQAGSVAGASQLLAKAHHGSVSKDQRALIEDDLKSGRLRAVVATSSLELGIDMGAVDLVIQVESPPSVASGLQRVGRAGHQVGEISQGILFPKHRADLLHSAVTVERMLAGKIESLSIPANPLDILAQQTVAATALEPLDVDEWFETVRRSAPFLALPRSAFDATLDLLAGRYPSDEFAELRPRIVWDRSAGTITGRPGAQRLAVTSGGTIPDRGLFGVFIVGSEDTGTSPGTAAANKGGSTNRGWATSLRSAPRVGKLRTSPLTVCWSPPLLASQENFRFGRATPWAVRWNWAGRWARSFVKSAQPRVKKHSPGAPPRAWTSGRPTTFWVTWMSKKPPPPKSPMTRPLWWSVSTTNWATGGWCCTARSACRSMRPGHWPSPHACMNATGWTAQPWHPTTASSCGFHSWTTNHPAPTYSSLTRRNWTEL